MKKQQIYYPLLLITTLTIVLCTSCSKSVEKRFNELESTLQNEKEPIIFAVVQKGDAEMLAYMLEAGKSKVDVTDEYGNTPLILAAQIGHVEVVKILIAAGANLRASDKHGEPLIHLVAESGEIEVMKVLLASGLKVDERSDATGPLLYAPDGNSGYSHDVKRMIERNGGSVSTFSGYQPIHSAAEVGNVEMVKFLISVGADPQAKDSSGRTPLDYVDKTSLVDKGDEPMYNKLAVVRIYNPDQQETPPDQRSRVPTNEELQQRFFGK
jgi:hypothetical protein